ncbi:GMC family oxidoreductase [Sulfitobacter donghicola]|uniref:Choline dehydrogenase n=1 Tax=Sulfitobacter donghicola DSW-25 = KCTC 12864 = JCM 14565 TaxID=1300350 RepID=A0A073IKW3_9RHOB|nr:GMC family oxidoreductase N-terminal domain-containing protein [Sulfitobacter donghicola]KEJ90225.1 choline dehydrogenase [Sulfitobacter donghicola DSW-25 = KCTC 12864 = JCM 14565]KIN66607.1 Oxidoreductase, GMC family protein [Sulfitobacter donghicola DSW-25 = KCTC 12864 = JCM 14565]
MENSEFDYVIVGAGSAGCVMANRLSASGKFTVLLLESGGSDARFWVKVPLGYGINVSNPAVNWGYFTAPDPGLAWRSISWPRGRIIGGSSSINAMAYVRGQAGDFDDWAAAGATGWHWDNVRAVYDRMETHCEITPTGQTTRGNGPVWVSDLSDQMSPFSKNFLKAAAEVGYNIIPDMNARDGDGISYYRSTVRGGLRWSSADAFLRPAQRRPNLSTLRNAEVAHLTSLNGTVTGVSFLHGDKRKNVKARREVILCAGAVNSPKILQLSGFGPAQLLRQHGIPVVRDLPHVGQGLQDHLAVSYQFHAKEPTLNNTLGRTIGKLFAGARYLLTRKGPLAVPVNQVGGFIRSKADHETPDVQLYCNPVSYSLSETGQTIVDQTAGYQLSAQPCRPTSRGAIEIASANPLEAPRITPNSLSTPEDKDTALAASQILQKLARTKSLSTVTKAAKAPDLLALDDAGLLEDFRNRASTVYHPTCTCRMGRDDQDSVLDARLRVHGVSGLRVVDASAFPNVTSGNTNAPTMMLAMRAADLILEDAG